MPNTESNLPTRERELLAVEGDEPAERLLDVDAGVVPLPREARQELHAREDHERRARRRRT